MYVGDFSDNTTATFLHMNLREPPPSTADRGKHLGVGWVPMEWQGHVGTVIVVRGDGRYLDPKHLEILCDFCQRRMQRLFQDLLEDPQDSRKKQAVDDELSHPAFER